MAGRCAAKVRAGSVARLFSSWEAGLNGNRSQIEIETYEPSWKRFARRSRVIDAGSACRRVKHLASLVALVNKKGG